MKPSTANSKGNSSSGGPKSRKNSKEREKRKSQSEKLEGAEKAPPAKDAARKYAGIGPDSIRIYSEQSNDEYFSDNVCYSFAEDLSYKLRHVIHDALVRARLCGRNHVVSSDIEAIFEGLNVDKVYGAPAAPNWITLGDHGLYYLDDSLVNLTDIAEEESSYIQPGDVVVTKKWMPEVKEPNKALKHYFETVCNAVVSPDVELKQTALNDIRTNSAIGPVVEWFYNFCYFLLSKDITYDTLTLSALDLIKALEYSPVAPLIVSEKQLILVVRLILQRLLRSHTTPEVLKPMGFTLGMLCNRVPIWDLVLAKLKQKLPEIKLSFALPILTIINALGYRAIQEVFVPNMAFFLKKDMDRNNFEYASALMLTYRELCINNHEDLTQIHALFCEAFCDELVPNWLHYKTQNSDEDRLDINWLQVKLKLMKTRRYVVVERKQSERPLVSDVEDAFPENSFGKKLKANLAKSAQTPPEALLNRVLVGKRSLVPVFKQNLRKSIQPCTDHSLTYLNL